MEGMELPAYESIPSATDVELNFHINEGFESELGTSKQSTAPLLSENEEAHSSYDNFEPDIVSSNVPAASSSLCTQNRPKIYMPNSAALTEQMIRKACYEYTNDSCCYGTSFIRDMVMTNIVNSFTLNYKLESVGEKRETVSGYTPYFGQPVDGSENGPAPEPWDVVVPEATEFKDAKLKLEIPHTAYVKVCHTCNGNRKIPCDSCYGNGSYTCFQCEGRRRNSNFDRCVSCDGSGKRECLMCSASGEVECRLCDGYGKLKHYTLLIITRKTHSDDFLSNTMNLPKECILSISGRIIFTEQNKEVLPLTNAPDRLVCEASNNLIHKHKTTFTNELIVLQRHTLRAVPLTKVQYSWKNNVGKFYIYGFKNKVFFDRYPEKCYCCSCNIL